jgi:hypothetical protein
VKHFSELLQKAAFVFRFKGTTGGGVGHVGCSVVNKLSRIADIRDALAALRRPHHMGMRSRASRTPRRTSCTIRKKPQN